MPALGARDDDRCTILIPTYRRPAELARLLRFLRGAGWAGPIIVIDSSPDALGPESARAAAARYQYLPPTTPVPDKFAAAVALADTPYCVLCADDDLVIPAALRAVLDALDAHPSWVAAHGRYLGFEALGSGRIDLLRLVYAGADLADADPHTRLGDLMRQYEALTYAVFRHGVARRVFSEAATLEAPLLWELATGGLAAAAGPVRRLAEISHLRHLGPSHGYERWHPIEWLYRDPADLITRYARYRLMLARWLGDDPARLARIDLAHLAYLARYLTPQVADHLLAERAAGREVEAMMVGVWHRLHPASSPWRDRLRGSALLRDLRDRLAPGWSLDRLARLRGAEIIRTPARPAGYRIAKSLKADRGAIDRILPLLDLYR